MAQKCDYPLNSSKARRSPLNHYWNTPIIVNPLFSASVSTPSAVAQRHRQRAAPAVTVTPIPLSFPSTVHGVMCGSIPVRVMNSGNASLPISSVVLGGSNHGDFTMTNGCSGAYAPSAGCSITLTFTPLAAGQRSAIISITEDATNSPQVIKLGGFANSALTLGAAPSGSTSATINAGQTAQYNPEITPDAGFTGTVSPSCSGAPVGATIQGRSTLEISTSAATPFTVSRATAGARWFLAILKRSAPRAFPCSPHANRHGRWPSPASPARVCDYSPNEKLISIQDALRLAARGSNASTCAAGNDLGRGRLWRRNLQPGGGFCDAGCWLARDIHGHRRARGNVGFRPPSSVAAGSVDADRELADRLTSQPRCGKSFRLHRPPRATTRPAQPRPRLVDRKRGVLLVWVSAPS